MRESSSQPLPVVVHVGFAGSRDLLGAGSTLSAAQRDEFHLAVQSELERRLKGLSADLELSPWHFPCGVSQIATGGDTLFSRACAAMPMPQRVFLPQTLDSYLDAISSHGTPDFTEQEKSIARGLLELPHIIQVRVVSDSDDRTSRFEDANLAILRASDVMICLLRGDATGKPGGTIDLLEDAQALGKPLLEIRVTETQNQPEFACTWHRPTPAWKPPRLSAEFASEELARPEAKPVPGIPITASRYVGALKRIGSRHANVQRVFFKTIALRVIGAHVLATLCAVIGMSIHHAAAEHGSHHPPLQLLILLGVEVLLLAAGFLIHRKLHHSETVRIWATSRLTAEIARSVDALCELHVPLEYLFTLPFPRKLRPLLQTIDVLHLASSKQSQADWNKKRDRYIDARFDKESGQLAYYRKGLHDAKFMASIASRCFLFATLFAIVAAAGELILNLAWKFPALEPAVGLLTVLGPLAVLLPVIAVAALSLAASFDLEARVHTYQETLQYLVAARLLFDAARSERAFIHLVMETESRLLGETANWASRRSFTSIA